MTSCRYYCLTIISLGLGLLACHRNRPPDRPDPPLGSAIARTGVEYAYSAFATDREGDLVSIRIDWGRDTSAWQPWLESGTDMRLSHAWFETGSFAVRAQARDTAGRESDWSQPLMVVVADEANNPPAVQGGPRGPTQLGIGVAYEFLVTGRDEENDSLAFQLLWDVAETSDWTLPTAPGSIVRLTHEWQTSGRRGVRARCRDQRGATSRWSRALAVKVARLGSVEWKTAVHTAAGTCPAVGEDSAIYVSSPTLGLVCLNPDGTERWSYGRPCLAAAAIGPDRSVYATPGWDHDTWLTAFDPDGAVRWRTAIGGHVYGAPATGPDGTIYVGTSSGRFCAFNPDGSLRWQAAIGAVVASAAIGPDSTIYVLRSPDTLFAFRPDGSMRWKRAAANDVHAALAIAADGAIYLPTWEGSTNFLLCLEPDGTERWRCATPWASAPAVIDRSGNVYLGTNQGTFLCITRTGSIRWTRTVGGAVTSAAAIAADGSIFFGADDGFCYCLNPDGTLRWRSNLGTPIRQSPISIGRDGTVLCSAGDGGLFALHGVSPLAADAPWPKFQRDPANTGSVQP